MTKCCTYNLEISAISMNCHKNIKTSSSKSRSWLQSVQISADHAQLTTQWPLISI